MLLAMICCVVYPLCHEVAQVYMTGLDYLTDAWNLGDFGYIILSIVNFFV